MSQTSSQSSHEVPVKIVRFKVTTDVPEYSVRVGDELLKFDPEGKATLALPVGSEWIVYYDLYKTRVGQTFEMVMSERQSPVRHTIQTDAQFANGFAGLDIIP